MSIKLINNFLESKEIAVRVKKAPKSFTTLNAIHFKNPVVFTGRNEIFELDRLLDARYTSRSGKNLLIKILEEHKII